jgi:hypothetical protein
MKEIKFKKSDLESFEVLVWASVRASVGASVSNSVWASVGALVGDLVWEDKVVFNQEVWDKVVEFI